VVGLIGLGLNALIIYIFTELAHVYYLLSKIISTIIVFLWNFLARRYSLTFVKYVK
jgi:putative flippase GtrA